jgi:hypothetical protein
MHSNSKKNFALATSIITCTIALQATNIHASELDLRISNDSLHGNFTLDNSRSKAKFGLGYFYKNDDYSINIVNLDLHAKGQTALLNMPASIGIGFETNGFKFDSVEGGTIGLGGNLRLNIPSIPGLSVETSLHYAPEVLSFGDTDEFRRFRAQANYRIIENADVAFGYRYIAAGIEGIDKNVKLESGVYLGLQLDL